MFTATCSLPLIPSLESLGGTSCWRRRHASGGLRAGPDRSSAWRFTRSRRMRKTLVADAFSRLPDLRCGGDGDPRRRPRIARPLAAADEWALFATGAVLLESGHAYRADPSATPPCLPRAARPGGRSSPSYSPRGDPVRAPVRAQALVLGLCTKQARELSNTD